jgi:hypothetical protein
MKDVVLLAVSVYLLKQDLVRASHDERADVAIDFQRQPAAR